MTTTSVRGRAAAAFPLALGGCLLAAGRLPAKTEIDIPMFAGGYGTAFFEESAAIGSTASASPTGSSFASRLRSTTCRSPFSAMKTAPAGIATVIG